MYYNGDHLSGYYNAGLYQVEVRAWADNNHDTGKYKLLDIEVIDPCLKDIMIPENEFESQNYSIGSGIKEYSIVEVSDTGFYHPQPSCGDLIYVAELYYLSDPDDETVLAGPIDIYREDSNIVLNSDGTFTIESSDLRQLGSYQMQFCAYLEEHPSTETKSVTILPLTFSRCKLSLQGWQIEDVIVPPITEVVQVFDEPIFSYRGSDDCGYFWTKFSLTVRDGNGSKIENLEEHLLFDTEHRTISYL